jgi:uncharacterized protein YerC
VNNPPSKGVALAQAKRRQTTLNRLEAQATEAATARDLAVFLAQEKGATYAEIQEATGLSTARVTQVLRKVRESQTTTTD